MSTHPLFIGSEMYRKSSFGRNHPLSIPRVSTVILGASKKSQLEDNLKALDSKSKLTPDVTVKIEEIVGNKPPAPERY